VSDLSVLGELLSANLARVEKPENYDSLRSRLASIKLNRDPPKIKESPENMRQIGKWPAEEL